jgi:uncharacterized protein HemX
MNPPVWLLAAGPAAVAALLIYFLVYQDTTATARVERERQHLEALRFDRDFARAWNGQELESSGLEARIREAEGRLRQAEQTAADRQKPLEELARGLDEITPETLTDDTDDHDE